MGKKKKEFEVVKLAVFAGIASVGGWLIFQGITGFFGLKSLTPGWSLIVGLVIVYISFKLGLDKILKR